jgi:sulfoxide reductase catalytic subunit YedY
MLIKSKRGWELPDSAATPETLYLDRRTLAKAIAAGPIIAAASALPFSSASASAVMELIDQQLASDPTLDLYPAPLNDTYPAGRAITDEELNSTYNNFYEFSSGKQVWLRVADMPRRPWTVTFDGLVEEEKTVDIDTLIRAMTLEERVYRHRCVERWAMVVPWTGFPLSKLVEYARPLGSAKYVVMQTFEMPDVAPQQLLAADSFPWPYTEGVTIEEAMNDLAFMVTGAYGHPVANQMGAPLRLHLPWKYGFKSIKSIVRVSFTEERPRTFWEDLVPSEYGFWANINPEVPHRRWSQAEEELLGSNEQVPTQLYNGYGEYVAGLYTGMEGEALYM